MRNGSLHSRMFVFPGLLLLVFQLGPVAAELPSLDKAPWQGYFAAYEHRRFHFGITARGKISLIPLRERDKAVGKSLSLPIDVLIEEVREDRTTIIKKILPNTLESADPPSAELEKTLIRGKVTGDAVFELELSQTRGKILLGGRVVNRGNIKNPLRFSIRTRFPNCYPYIKPRGKNQKRRFAERIEDDHLVLKWTDGQRRKQRFDAVIDAASKELNGPGISCAQIETDAYEERRFVFTASPGSSLTLANATTLPAPLHRGFNLIWRADPDAPSPSVANLSIEVRR